jgi:hypothetical protein
VPMGFSAPTAVAASNVIAAEISRRLIARVVGLDIFAPELKGIG